MTPNVIRDFHTNSVSMTTRQMAKMEIVVAITIQSSEIYNEMRFNCFIGCR